MKLTDYVNQIINGPGGYKVMVEREGGDESPEEVARFVIRCLANIDCEGSGDVVDVLVHTRNEKAWEKRLADFNTRRDAGKLAPGEVHPLDLLDLG